MLFRVSSTALVIRELACSLVHPDTAAACNSVPPDTAVSAAAVGVAHMDLEHMMEPEGVGIQPRLVGEAAEAMVARVEVGIPPREVVEEADTRSPVGAAAEGVGRDFHTQRTWCRILDL